MTEQHADVIVIGGGPAGLTAGVALATTGADVALLAPPPAGTDRRTAALMAGSVTALAALGVWQRCVEYAAPLRGIRIVDATGRLIHAPEILFRAEEIGLDAFAWNIENRRLTAALETQAATLPNLRLIRDTAANIELTETAGHVRLAGGGGIAASLVVGADGRNSLSRAAAGIGTRGWSYPQTALVCTLSHSRSHHDISTEFHTPAGPFTLVPLAPRRSSVVLVSTPQTAGELMALEDSALSAEIERRAQSMLGRMTVEPGRGTFPLAYESALAFSGRRTMLVGEAAHLVPPIGAQGLNLGLRDAAAAAECVADARRAGRDIGGREALSRYDAARRRDIGPRGTAIDWLNRSLLSDLLPVQAGRALGLGLLGRMAPLRRLVMREGVAPTAGQPRLMRGEPV